MAMGSRGILLANAVNMQYRWQTGRSAGSQDRLGEGLGARARPSRPEGGPEEMQSTSQRELRL
jgi:hypothetical protein